MHRCLFITEILYLIFEEIWSGAEQRHKTLATMARCCRAFEAPALDVLWRAQDSLEPLLACLPADIWQDRDGVRCLVRSNGVDSVGRQKCSPSQSRAINPDDTIRFDHYAKRINMLTVPLSEYTADTIETLSRTGSLFPNLHNLDARIVEAVFYTSLNHLLVPSLKTLKIFLRSETEYTSPMFSNLPLKCPAVMHVSLRIGSTGLPLHSEDICCWKDLRSLRARLSDSRALTHLSTMHSLSVLDIHLPIHLEPEQFTFRTLKKLVIETYPASCVDFLCSLRAPSLVALTINVDDGFQPWKRVFEVIGQRLCDSPLTELSIFQSGGFEAPPMSMNHFRPLYAFANMTAFTSHVSPQFLLEDDGIREMASAWPSLHTLRLPSGLGPRRAPFRVSLAGLAFLAQMCQNLTRLELGVCTTICADPVLHTTTPDMLINLDLSPVEGAGRVAAFFAREFENNPELRSGRQQSLAVQEHLLSVQEQGSVLFPFARTRHF
jgi:hypothetical protein